MWSLLMPTTYNFDKYIDLFKQQTASCKNTNNCKQAKEQHLFYMLILLGLNMGTTVSF